MAGARVMTEIVPSAWLCRGTGVRGSSLTRERFAGWLKSPMQLSQWPLKCEKQGLVDQFFGGGLVVAAQGAKGQ